MVYFLKLIQCLSEKLLQQKPNLVYRLLNDTGYSVIVGSSDEYQRLLTYLEEAFNYPLKQLDVRLSRQEGKLVIDCSNDGAVLSLLHLPLQVEWQCPLVKLPGRLLHIEVISQDQAFQDYCQEIGDVVNALCVPSRTSGASDAEMRIVDQRDHLNPVFKYKDIPTITVHRLSPLEETTEQTGSLWWPFFDSDLKLLVNDFRLRQPLRVLVADDSKPSQIATQIMLESIGCQVVTTDDGTAALEQAVTQAFDVVFLDERMPGLFGSEVAEKLRDGASHNCDIAKVSLTGVTEPEKIAELYAAGITHYLKKPVTRLMLEEFLNTWRNEWSVIVA